MQYIHIKGVYFSSKILCIIAINLCIERILIIKLIKVETNNSNSPYQKSLFNIIQIGKCLIQCNSKIQEKNFKIDFFSFKIWNLKTLYLNNRKEEWIKIHPFSKKIFHCEKSQWQWLVSRAWLWAWQYCIKGYDWWPNRTKILVAADLIHSPKHL